MTNTTEPVEMKVVTLQIAAPAAATVAGVVQLRTHDGRCEAVLNALPGRPVPAGAPTALRWLADLLEIRALDEADRG